MHHVLVIGGVHPDTIWQLDAPLVPGGRLRTCGKSVVFGGGGFHTGSALIALGAKVTLISRLMRDTWGLSAFETLQSAGFDMRHVELSAGETQPLDILLDPNGERTILAPVRSGQAPLCVKGPLCTAAAYLNALQLDQTLLQVLQRTPLVISQLPLRPATPRPADYVVTSRADAGTDIANTWTRAKALAGVRLKALVVTDGPRPVTVYDGAAPFAVDTRPVDKFRNSIGAGDRFCGALLLALLDGAPVGEAAAIASSNIADWLSRQAST
ncbi:PfkB family carbohydrate kinase [Bradyrhizobium sp. LHD-71]|uniref:PfkB family carbohydrate kinase n=1 Tax=Bradyrhizobium sp. LHD-71 TaxID=3072141 RepID=UPI00280F0D39|nr:PfkB family carbohydrate kinase [Bradyrhizobium sp. LHD-71]MDQ8731101.1 PfkB family carbohydrate kinase [Bradyrhizobium sp. LHD-71]